MRLRVFILVLLSFSIAFCSSGQNSERYTQSRILFLLDESSSMLQTWFGDGSSTKYKVANDIIVRLMDSVYAVNKNVEFSLRVFGNQYTVPEHNCTDTKNEVAFSPDNRTQMQFRLDALHPLGVTAIAYSLSQAAENDLTDVAHNAYSIILITDGGESCGGDICGVMQKLIKNKVFFKPYILSLEDDPELKNEYDCMGDYLSVTHRGDIPKAVTTIVDAFRPILKISKEEYQKLQLIAANTPSILKVNIPPIKTEIPKTDTIVVKPKPVIKPKPETPIKPEPKPKSADTVVATLPLPKPSKITVGEEKARPAPTPVKIKKMAFSALAKFFTAPAKKITPKTIYVTAPEYKPAVVDVPIVIPAPVKMKLVGFSALAKLKTTKPKLSVPEKTVVVVPEIKQPEAPPTPLTIALLKPSAIKRIKIKKATLALAQTIAIEIPEFKQPEAAPTPLTIALLKTSPIKRIKIKKATLAIAQTITVDVPEYKEPEVAPTQLKLALLKPSVIKRIKVTKGKIARPEAIAVNVPENKPIQPDVVKVDTVVPPPVVVKRKPDVFTKLKPAKFRMHLLYITSDMDAKVARIKVTPPPSYVPKPETTVTKPKPADTKPVVAKPTPKTGEYKVEHEDAKVTTLEVYLTNGRGKFFATNPRIVLKDQATGKEIRKFYRMVDPSGNPDPITDLPVGKYDLEIVGRDDLLAHVDMQPNKRNKVYIKVKDYSLYFYYIDAPERPVIEYSAEVIQRNVASGKITIQKCTEKLEYEPGNYHITINTFPQNIHNIDLDMESAGGIGIPQPGFAKFVSEVNTNSVALFKELGDRFAQFTTLNLKDPAIGHLPIQPGRYQAHYNNGETKFGISERVITFEIKSTKETIITLVK